MFNRRMAGDGHNSLDQPSIPTERKVSPSYEGGPDFALGDGPGRGSCMHALPRPGQKHKLPPPERVVQGDNHRRRRGAAKRPRAGVGSGGLPGHQRRYVDLSDITITVRSPYSPQSARTAAYHRQLCSIGNWAHGDGTVAAMRLTNRRYRPTTTPHLHTKGFPISR